MKELYQKISKELESSGRYEFATAELLNALLFKDKNTDSIEKNFKKLKPDLEHYWDLLDELNIEDDLREILIDLISKINTYNIIDALLEVTKHEDRILSLAKKYKKYFIPVLKEIHKTPGITDYGLEAMLTDQHLKIKKNELVELLRDLYSHNLIAKTYSSYDETDSNVFCYYFLTATGIKYFKLLNNK